MRKQTLLLRKHLCAHWQATNDSHNAFSKRARVVAGITRTRS
jgi:hypothetical protein